MAATEKTAGKNWIRRLIDDDQWMAGRIFDFSIQFLIIASVVTFSVETLPGLDPKVQTALDWFEAFVIGVFTIEYLTRFYVAEHKRKFVFSFYSLIDLAVLVPFYLALALDLRALRVFWLFRLLRLVKLARYNESLDRFQRAFLIARTDLTVFLIMTMLLLYLSAVGIYFFENEAQPEHFKSVFHSLWWAVATLTTVGYGDVFPITIGGRLFTFGVLMVGLGIVAVPTGLISTALMRARDELREEAAQARRQDAEARAAAADDASRAEP